MVSNVVSIGFQQTIRYNIIDIFWLSLSMIVVPVSPFLQPI